MDLSTGRVQVGLLVLAVGVEQLVAQCRESVDLVAATVERQLFGMRGQRATFHCRWSERVGVAAGHHTEHQTDADLH
jgi:hypothetical protein